MRQISQTLNQSIGQTVEVAGWVNSRRDHGGLIFIDLRDHGGLIQLVITPENKPAFHLAERLRDEDVISGIGLVRSRAPELINPKLPTGKIEVVLESLFLLNKSQTPPINTHDEGPASSEELRLKYRFLDLRRPSMQNLVKKRSEFYQILRNFMIKRDFLEVPTPILANSSPEGARDFLVPSRLHFGKFYALPQAPQQFKQLLMVGGVPRYFQIAPCFRDEDPRADRLYGDFYQLDLEMSFVENGEIVRQTTEPLIIDLVKNFGQKKLVLNSEPARRFLLEPADHTNTAKSNTTQKIPRLPYNFCLETYGTDKPDLRFGLEIIELTPIFKQTNFKVFQTPCVKAIRVPHGASFTRSQIDALTAFARQNGAGGLAYILFENNNIKSPILKFLSDAEISAIRHETGAEESDAIFFGAGERAAVNKVLGLLRSEFADLLNLKKPDEIALCWVTDFPFYEWNDGERKLDFGHNPFSMPKGGLKALTAAKTDAEILQITADQYDMVMNGYEICSGAVRNHQPDIMYQAFALLGYDKTYVESRFGGMLSAFKFGAPPHAGCAFGIDRIFMVLMDAANIRDVVAFPKNGSGIDVMMNAPSPVDSKLLRDTHIKIVADGEELD